MLVSRLDQVATCINGLFQQMPKIDEFFEILDTTPAVHDRPGAQQVARFDGEVAFEGVGFSYNARRKAMEDVSFTARAGETIALVGTTGSGKSTTLGLLHRAFDPRPRRHPHRRHRHPRHRPRRRLRHNIGVVFQEPMLFARSIRENLQVGRPDATDAEMLDALERAQATEFMARQADGLDTVIGERGRSLSGGERQRLSIARALLKNPPVLILDEATSALDATTERKLQGALEAVMEGRTTFVIAHRLATIRNADRILVFHEGRIVEIGQLRRARRAERPLRRSRPGAVHGERRAGGYAARGLIRATQVDNRKPSPALGRGLFLVMDKVFGKDLGEIGRTPPL